MLSVRDGTRTSLLINKEITCGSQIDGRLEAAQINREFTLCLDRIFILEKGQDCFRKAVWPQDVLGRGDQYSIANLQGTCIPPTLCLLRHRPHHIRRHHHCYLHHVLQGCEH